MYSKSFYFSLGQKLKNPIGNNNLNNVDKHNYIRFTLTSLFIKQYKKSGLSGLDELKRHNVKNFKGLLFRHIYLRFNRPQWVTPAFLLLRYADFELFQYIVPMTVCRTLCSEGFKAWHVISSSEENGEEMVKRLKYISDYFDSDFKDKFGRPAIFYAKEKEVFWFLQNNNNYNNDVITKALEHMALSNNMLFLNLISDYDSVLASVLLRGPPSIQMIINLLARSHFNKRLYSHSYIALGMIYLFNSKAKYLFQKANRYYRQVPLNNERNLYEFCDNYFKGIFGPVSIHRQNFLICCTTCDEYDSILGPFGFQNHLMELNYRAYITFVNLILENPEANFEEYARELCFKSFQYCPEYLDRQIYLDRMIETFPAIKNMRKKLDWIVKWAFQCFRNPIDMDHLQQCLVRIVRLRDYNNKSILHVLCRNPYLYGFEFFNLCIDLGAPIDIQDKCGNTPLFLLCFPNKYYGFNDWGIYDLKQKFMMKLIEKGAHVDSAGWARKRYYKMLKCHFKYVPSLQCLCARILKTTRGFNKKLKYLPKPVRDFVNLH